MKNNLLKVSLVWLLPIIVFLTEGPNAQCSTIVTADYSGVNCGNFRGSKNTIPDKKDTLPAATIYIIESSGVLDNDGVICDGDNAVLDVGAYVAYQWSTGETTQTITVTSGGYYEVTVTTGNGNQEVAGVTVVVNPLPSPTILIYDISGITNDDGVVCYGDDAVLTLSNNYSTYEWSTGETTQTIVASTEGDYTVTVTDGNGCQGTATATIIVNYHQLSFISVSETSGVVNNDGIICEGAVSVLNPVGNNISYSWSTGEITENIVVAPIFSADYTVTVTDTNGCWSTSSLTMIVNPLPTPYIAIIETSGHTDDDGVICSGDNAVLDAGAHAAYQWSTGEITQTITATSGGYYEVTVVDYYGCEGTTGVTIVEDFLPSPYITVNETSGITNDDGIMCMGDYAILDAGTYSSYEWSTGEIFQTIVVSSAGDYTVTVTDGSGCQGTAVVTIITNPLPTPVILVNETSGIFNNDGFICEGDVAVLSTTGNNISYSWSTGETTPTITVTSSGDYSATVTDINGCWSVTIITIQENSLPSPFITLYETSGHTNDDGLICQGDYVTLDAGAYSSYHWSTGELTQTIAVSTVGNYIVTVTDGNGCEGTAEVTVVVNPLPMPIISDEVVCSGEVAILDAGAYLSYYWSTGETTQTIAASSSGDYTVTVEDGNGCEGMATLSVIENSLPFPAITISETSGFVNDDGIICDGDVVTLDAGSNSNYVAYSWSNGGSGQVISVINVGDYTVTVTDTNGCEGTAVVTIVGTPLPIATITAPSTELSAQNPTISLDVSTSTGQGTLSYLWSDNSTASTLVVSTVGTYTVTVMDGNNGCMTSTSITITENLVDLYVDHTATGANNGSSWGDAFTDLQDALAMGAGAMIHIAKGTYYPTSGTIRGIAFEIPSSTTILGAYPNGGGTRNPALNETVLSGNIDGVGSAAGNSYHVVSVKNANDVTLDGLSIRDGNADNASSFGRSRGGGLFVNNATLTLKNVEVKWNKAIYGAGMFATLSPNVTLEDCTFKKNTANNGSAIYHSNQTNLYIDKTRIIDNNSLIRCAIEVNNSLYTKIENSVIANNASGNANAIAFIATNRDGTCDIYNTTILGETKNKFLITMQVGFGDQLDLSLYNSIVSHQDPTFTQIFKDFNNGILNLNTTNCYVQGSTVQGNAMNNLYSATAGDLMLNPDYSLGACSPGVDDGNNAYAAGSTDINGVLRIINTVDMGAYENVLACRAAAKENKISTVSVFPNPTMDKISIQTDLENPVFHLFDLLGKEVFQTNEKEMNLGTFPEGIYILRIMEGDELIESVKVIKN